MLHIIAALSPNNVIGENGCIPWNIPQEQALFKQLTTGHVVIMGRKTFETCVGRPLPDRHNIIVTHNPLVTPPSLRPRQLAGLRRARQGCYKAGSLPEALNMARSLSEEIFIIGGAQLYAQALPLADVLHISRLKQEYKGDTFFPEFSTDDWHITKKKEYDEFTHITYKRAL